MKLKIFLVLSILAVTSLIGACQPDSPESDAPEFTRSWGEKFTISPCRVSAPFGIKLTCGTVVVPLDYANPGGETTTIAVAVAHSKSDSPRPDPVIFLPISPGVSGLQLMGWLTQSIGSILREHDVIFYDPRGVGQSEPVLTECEGMMGFMFQGMGRGLFDDQILEQAVDVYHACRDASLVTGIDLSNYTTEQHVADLNSIRTGLGYREVNLLGSGYGYELALRLLRESSEGIRSLVIVSPEDTQHTYQSMSGDLQSTLDRVFQACQKDADCAAAYPDVEGELYQAIDLFNRQPVQVNIRRRGEQQGFELDLSGFLLVEITRMLLLSEEGLASLPGFIHDIASERTAVLDDAIWRAAFRRGSAQTAAVMSAHCPVIASIIPDEVFYNSANALLQEQHQATLRLEQAACKEWYGKSIQPARPVTAFADTPVLVLQGQYTPNLPASALNEQLGEMRNARVVEFPNTGGDIAWSQPCTASLVTAFLDLPVSDLAATCVERLAPVRFVLPNQEALPLEEPQPLEEPY